MCLSLQTSTQFVEAIFSNIDPKQIGVAIDTEIQAAQRLPSAHENVYIVTSAMPALGSIGCASRWQPKRPPSPQPHLKVSRQHVVVQLHDAVNQLLPPFLGKGLQVLWNLHLLELCTQLLPCASQHTSHPASLRVLAAKGLERNISSARHQAATASHHGVRYYAPALKPWFLCSGTGLPQRHGTGNFQVC